MAQASEDIFHDVIMSEEKSQMEGYAAGHSEGLKVGLMEGYNLGWEKGASIGSELGFYSGFCSALLKQLEQEENKKSRALRVLQSIIKLVEEFPMTDPTHSQLIELLQQIRSKFKQMTSLLNIDASYGGGEISQSKGVSF